MHLAPLRRIGGVVDGGAHERMPELDAAVGDRDEPGGLGLLQRGDVEVEQRARRAR